MLRLKPPTWPPVELHQQLSRPPSLWWLKRERFRQPPEARCMHQVHPYLTSISSAALPQNRRTSLPLRAISSGRMLPLPPPPHPKQQPPAPAVPPLIAPWTTACPAHLLVPPAQASGARPGRRQIGPPHDCRCRTSHKTPWPACSRMCSAAPAALLAPCCLLFRAHSAERTGKPHCSHAASAAQPHAPVCALTGLGAWWIHMQRCM